MRRSIPKLSQEQKDELAEWEASVSPARASGRRFGRRCSDSWKSLSPSSKIEPSTSRACRSLRLKLSLKSTQRTDKELRFGKNFMLRCYPQLSQEQKDELAEWEAMLCEPGEGERQAFRPSSTDAPERDRHHV